MWWLVLGVILFILFFFGRRNLQIYVEFNNGSKGWTEYKLPLIVWIFAGIIALVPLVNAVAFGLWFIVFSIKLAMCNRESENAYLEDIRVIPEKKNWVGILVKVLSKRY